MTSAILDPTGLSSRENTTPAFSLAPRPTDLGGVRVGLLENGKQNARRFLEDVADVLRERGIPAAGPPFWKYNVIDMERLLEVEHRAVVGDLELEGEGGGRPGDDRGVHGSSPSGVKAGSYHNYRV